jgi:hypothetical protein
VARRFSAAIRPPPENAALAAEVERGVSIYAVALRPNRKFLHIDNF